ncbi:hypothetical protein [Faecalibacillus faecis]|uniref:hypothetical protein n=1 Tax=Faecalibacillus faecis TaxID=1982628 RepID=UPI0038644209
MSINGYFKAVIENYFKAEKKTPKVKAEAKELINQFKISEKYEEFEDIEEYKIMKVQIKQIYDEVYNNK